MSTHKRVNVPTTTATPVTRMAQRMAQGHYVRTGHALNAVYTPTGLFGSLEIVRLCCEVDS